MTKFGSFIPGQLLARTADGATEGPACARFDGAVVFADISGYTQLAERFCAQGAEGAEQLSIIQNQAFSSYISCIHNTGGEVANFAGDALLAYWPATREAPAVALRRAQDCASALHRLSLGNSPDSPQLHVGLATGVLWVAQLGGVDGRWQILLAGDAVRDAGRAAAVAGRGETVLSQPAQALACAMRVDRFQIEPITQAPLASGVRGIETARLELRIQQLIQQWAREAPWKWLPQFRNICALFVRIDGLDENAPNALDRHQAAVSVLQKAVPYSSRSGCSLSLDESGLVYRLCLGLPHDTHANDALRAARAGLAIDQGLKHLGLGCAGGLAIGRGLCAAIGGPERRQYVAIGQFMHLAARLMQNASQGLLCSAELADLLRGHIDWIPEPPLRLKGIREEIDVIRVKVPKTHPEKDEKLFGRATEKDWLESRLEDLARGQGAVVWLTGDAGIGKSTLIRHLHKEATRRNIACLAGDSASAESTVPYLAWRQILSRLLKVDWPVAGGTSRGSVAPILPNDLQNQELGPLLNSVLPGLLVETPLVRGLSGRARTDATINFLSEVIGDCGGNSFLLSLEDCHWMDSASWRLVERIARDFPRALLILTSRPHGERKELGALRSLERFAELPLAPLGADAVGDIVRDLIADVDLRSSVVEQVVAQSAGNPFFAREYALLLQTTARNGTKRAGRRLSREIDDVETPITVQGLVTSRLNSLQRDEISVLKAASVLGNLLDFPVLRHVLSQEIRDSQLNNALLGLARCQLLTESDDGGRTCHFRHEIIRRVTYDQLTSSEREKLHREMARAIECVHINQLESQFATLAHHWSMARAPAAAVKYSDLAADQALGSGAYSEAERLLQTCLDLTERSGSVPASTERLVRWHRKLADVHQGLGQVEPRATEAWRALALAGRPRSARLAGVVTQVLMRSVRFCRRLAATTRPLANPGADQALTLELARAYRHSAATCWFSNNSIGMICDILSAVECAESAPASSVLASAYAELGGILGVVGLRQIGERVLPRALDVAEMSGDVGELAYVHMLTGLYACGIGDWSTALRSSSICQELSVRTYDHFNWCNAQAVLFWFNHYHARTEKARALADALQDRAAYTGNRQHQAWALRFQAVCDIRQGKPADAVQRLEQALDALGETAALNERIPIIGSLALARSYVGDVAAARADLWEGLTLAESVARPAGHATLEGYSALCEVALSNWRAAPSSIEWRRASYRSLQVFKRYRRTFPIGEARYRKWQGYYRRQAGRELAALSSFNRGALEARKRGMAWDEAQCVEALTKVGICSPLPTC